MEPVIPTKVMRDCDEKTIRSLGGDGVGLIERAGRAIFEACEWEGPVLIAAGTGNNAADGFAIALLLAGQKIPVRILLAEDKTSADGAVLLRRCRDAGIPVSLYEGGALPHDVRQIADCLFGTGFHGEVTGVYRPLIEEINALHEKGVRVVSADINSGLSGDSGQGTCAVISDLTVSVGYLQPGHLLGRARDVIGRLENRPVGILPPERAGYFPDGKDLGELLPPRPHDSHKGNYGYVTLIGGCREYAGAAKLAMLGASALRAGCGVVRIAVPDCIADSVTPFLLEQTLLPLPSDGGFLAPDEAALDRALGGAAAIAFGMGIGRCPRHEATLRALLDRCRVPLVLDADGLNTLAAAGTDLLLGARCPVILTPHPLEFARLSGISAEEMKKDPTAAAEAFARKYGVILLLKGTGTVITDGTETYYTNRGSAGMATAGSGDVLSGVLCGLLGYLAPTPKTVCLGAYLCGLAGELAAADVGDVSMTSGDTARALAAAVRTVTAR